MNIRSDLIQIIGYQGETCLPNEKPVTAFFTDRYLNPVLDGLVEYVEEARADERERTLTTELRSIIDIESRQALTDLRAKVKALPVAVVDLDLDPHGRPIERRAVLLSDVLALFRGGTV